MKEFQFNRNEETQILLTNARKAVTLCEEITPGSGMLFFTTLKDIESMSADERVELVYMPTYTVAAYLIQCKMHLNELFTQDEYVESGFKGILLACASRGMEGQSSETLDALTEALDLFLTAPLKAFLAKYGKEYPEFTECAQKAVKTLYEIAGGTIHSSDKLVRKAKELISVWESA